MDVRFHKYQSILHIKYAQKSFFYNCAHSIKAGLWVHNIVLEYLNITVLLFCAYPVCVINIPLCQTRNQPRCL